MKEHPATLACREVGQWRLHSGREYENPFADVDVEATFRGPRGDEVTVPGFYDGNGDWLVRWSPGEPGRWEYVTRSRPADPDLRTKGELEATPLEGRGFLRTTPGEAWGLHYESGEPVLVFGDTTYNLFGMAHCGGEVEGFVRRRLEQGINLLRVRLAVSPFHGPEGYSRWQTRRTWPWGGSEQCPQFDRMNLEYFRTVDRVVELCESVGMGLEMIMEAWGFEFPWNSRDVFVAEWEDLWMRHLLARYDAYGCVWFWTLMNEYEYYPDGNMRGGIALASRWAMRRARWLKATAPHGHVVAIHNGPQMPPFAERFARDPEAIDHVMFQCWGSMGDDDSWLAAGIEEQVRRSLEDWPGSAVLSEWGYERNPDLPEAFPYHDNCNVDHTRRGGWRGLFSGLGVIHGWENTWGPFMILDRDMPGMEHYLLMRHFFHEVVPFHRVRPAPQIVCGGEFEPGSRPLALADEEFDLVAVYLPTGGGASLELPGGKAYSGRWFDTRTGALSRASTERDGGGLRVVAPDGGGDHPWDWVLALEAH